MSPQTIRIKAAPTYVGKLANGKRVYVRPCKSKPGERLAFAVYADYPRPDGDRFELVARVADAMHGPDQVWDAERRHWVERKGGALLTAREMAEQLAQWHRNLHNKTDREPHVEIVELKPVGGK